MTLEINNGTFQNAGEFSNRANEAFERNRVNKNLMHFQPISARILNAIQYTSAFVYQRGPREGMGAEILRFLTVCSSRMGYILTIPVALTEAIASFAFFTLGLTFHAATGKAYAPIENFTAKLLAYSMNSTLAFAAMIATFVLPRINAVLIPRYRTVATGISLGSYLSSAMLAQYIVGKIFQGNDVGCARIVIAGAEGVSSALRGMFDSFVADFNPEFVHYIESTAFYETLNQEDQQFIQSFDIRNLIQEPYRQNIVRIAAQYLNGIGVQTVSGSNNELLINVYADADKTYQEALANFVKTATVKMIENDWVKYLSDDENIEEGKDLLESFDYASTIPLAHIAQLMELEVEIACPERFNHRDLAGYSDRKAKIEKAKQLLLQISSDEKMLLIKRLVKGGDPFESKILNELYLQTAELAGALHQGKLMSVTTFNAETGDFSSDNLFGRAWSDALNE